MLKIQDVGRHLVAGFDGTQPNEHLDELLKLGAGGIILFTRNFESPEQLRDLVRAIRERARGRIFISVDQEGGRVQRFKEPFTPWPAMADIGRMGDENLAGRFGAAVAKELAAVGIDWNFAPVLDVNSNPENPVIGDRAFGENPEIVTRMGVAVLCAMQNAGIMACAKHYPGHGHTSEDSHKTLPIVLDNEEILYERELPPFAAAIEAKVASIMPAHVIYAAWDMAHPASCSPNMISGRLRRALMFDGLVITDDLEMDAVRHRYEPHDLVLLSFTAGNDFLLACHTFDLQEFIVRTLFDGRKANLLPAEGFFQSAKRIQAMEKRFPIPQPPSLSVIGCEEHQVLAGEIRERAVND